MAEQDNQAKGLWAYFILTYAIMLLTWGLMAVFQIPGASAAGNATAPAPGPLLLLFLGGFSPSLAGVLMTWRVGGTRGLRDLWKRATRFNLGWQWYAVILLLPLLILGLRVGVQLARGGTLIESPLFIQPLNLISFTIPLILVGPLSEEFGWRGFALDRLLTRWNVLLTSLILGALWAGWHLALFFIPGTLQQLWGSPLVEFPLFAVWIMGQSVLLSWLYLQTGRSLFAVMLFHFVDNWLVSFSGTIMNGGLVDHAVNAVALAILAAVILMWWRPNRLKQMSSAVLSRKSNLVAVIESAVDIKRPAEEVFDYCSDHTREPEWNIRMKRVAKLSDGPLGVGTRYEMEFVPGHPMIVECVRFERPTAWDMVGESQGTTVGMRGQVLATEGGARLLLRTEIQPPGLLGLAVPLLRRRMQPELERDTAAIKAILES